MDYRDVFQVMSQTGLANDPAFANTKFLIQPIPAMPGCPLGLYVPERKSIILPPEFTPAAIYHEIGHAYGDYYHHNLSEQFAESFRRKYVPDKAALYTGRNFNLLAKMGRLFQEGEKGHVVFAVNQFPTAAALDKISSQFTATAAMYHERPPRVWAAYEGDSPVLHIDFTMGADWFMIIGTVLVAIIVADLGAIAYAIYKVNKELPWVLPLTLIALVSGLTLYGAYRHSQSHPGAFQRITSRNR